MLKSWLETGLSTLAGVPAILFDPTKRVFWPFLLASVLISALLYRCREQEDQNFTRSRASLFSKNLWFHRSSVVDLQLVVAKALIRAFLLAPLVLSAFTVAAFVVEQLTSRFGAAAPSALARWHITFLYTGTLFIAWDFSRFLLHRLMHAVPFLWEFHQVHHSAQVLTPFTNYRSHPIESLLYSLRGALITGFVSGVFFYWFRGRAVQYDILGVNAIGLLFNAAGANLRHTHVWLSYGRWFEHIFISPAQHQLHHSREIKHHGKNYGSFLAVWDWLFRSLCLAGKRQPFRVGLPEHELNHDPRCTTSCLLRPLASSIRKLAPTSLPRAMPPAPSRGLHETL